MRKFDILITIFLGFLFTFSEFIYRYSFQLLEISSLNQLINIGLYLSNLTGLVLFISAWGLSFIIRLLLTIPYSKGSSQLIPLFRLSIVIFSFILGLNNLNETLNSSKMLAICFAFLSLICLIIDERY